MKEISNHFYIVKPTSMNESLKINEQQHIPTDAKVIHCIKKCTFSQQAGVNDAGISWKMKFKAVTRDEEVTLWNGAAAYIGIIMTNGEGRIIGTYDECPEISVTPYPDGIYVVETEFESLSPIEL